jgi:predicted DNA-binding transcriptional regulator AlpA
MHWKGIEMSKATDRRTARKERIFEKRYISAPELAARWDVSTSAIYHGNCGSDALRSIRLGKSVRFLRTDVEALEKSREKH